jgi:Domain of unknown function (DUF4625)
LKIKHEKILPHPYSFHFSFLFKKITITSPASYQHFSIQDNIPVNATVSDNVQLKSVSLRILDSVMYLLQPMYATQNFDIPVNKKDYQLDMNFPVGINFKNAWRFTLTATDMSGNQTVKEVSVAIN